MNTVELNFSPLKSPKKSQQIVQQIRQLITSGNLKAGNKLPATRSIATDLNVARGTVITALDILIAEGLLISKTGSGTFVTGEYIPYSASISRPMFFPKPIHTVTANVDIPFKGQYNFQACRPSMEVFPRNVWRKSASLAASVLPQSDYDDPQGDLGLRQEIVAYLQRSRGLHVNLDEIIITNGAIHAMLILAKLYIQKGDCVAFEDPGYPVARQVFKSAGATIIDIAVDEDGMCVNDLPKDGGNIKLIYVTPSHQFPTGQRLSYPRRTKLLEWASEHDVFILEDDYDGEFRYDVPPLPPLAALCAKNHVVYFGTFSKTLFPSLRIGYAVTAKEVITEMQAYRTITDYQTNTLSQLTLKNFIEIGEFEKHIHRMRRIYAKKRQALKQAMIKHDFPGSLSGIDSGLNGLIKLHQGLSAEKISKQALEQDIMITPLSRYSKKHRYHPSALIIGYSALTMEQIDQGIEILTAIARG